MVVGNSGTGGEAYRAFVWEQGVLTDLGRSVEATLPDLARWSPRLSTSASRVNAKGQVIGGEWGYHRALLWEGGVATDMGTLGSDFRTKAVAINSRGQVVGNSTTPEQRPHAFLWERGVMTDLGTLGGTDSVAYSINAAGQVVGGASLAGQSSPVEHAFLWERGAMRDLGTLGGTISTAIRINDAGQVTGTAATADGQARAFLCERDRMRDLGTLPGWANSSADDLNAVGQVIGYSGPHRFLWEKGVMMDLHDLLPAEAGWEISGPIRLNDDGQIAGTGVRNGWQRAFLLSPETGALPRSGGAVATPRGALSLAAVGLAGVGVALRCRQVRG